MDHGIKSTCHEGWENARIEYRQENMHAGQTFEILLVSYAARHPPMFCVKKFKLMINVLLV